MDKVTQTKLITKAQHFGIIESRNVLLVLIGSVK